jgi:hypothetical protein
MQAGPVWLMNQCGNLITWIEQITKKTLEVECQEKATGGADDVDAAPGEKVTALEAFAKSEVYRILQPW